MRKKAFTFVELIIAVTIFAIIATSIYATFNAGLRLWLRTSPMIEENQALRMFYSTISSDLKNAVYYYDNNQTLNKPGFAQEYEGEINFKGEPGKISFISIVSIAESVSGLREEPARITYLYDSGAKTVKRLVATKSEGLDETKARSSEMIQNIEEKDFGFEYCYKKMLSNTDYEYEWKDAWEDKNVLNIPRGIRIKIGNFTKTVFIPAGVLGEEK